MIDVNMITEQIMTPSEFRKKLGNISMTSLKSASKKLPDRRTITNKRYYLPEDVLAYYNIGKNPDE